MKTLSSTKVAPAVGPYSQAIVSEKSNLIFVSGQVPRDPASGKLIEGDIKTLTKHVLDAISAILEAGNSSLRQVVRVEVFLIDMNDFQAMNEVYSDYFSEPYPARQTVQVSKLPLNARIEISCIAEIS